MSDFGDTLGVQDTLDLRLDRSAVRLDDLSDLRSVTARATDAALRAKIRLTTQIPSSLDQIAAERARAVTTLGLTLAQLAALVAVVTALLAASAVAAQRAELGLARLRGERAGPLRREVLGRWAVAVSVGWLLGWLPGIAALLVSGHGLPGRSGLPLGPALVLVPPAVLLIMVAGILPATHGVLRQPVIELLRAAPPATREAGGRQLLIDAVVLVLALTGVLVTVQSGTASVLAVLVPSLLAVACGVLLSRVMSAGAGLARRRWSRRGSHPGGLLTAVLLLRLRGLRLMVVTVALAAAFVVFVLQVQVIGADARRYEAEVRTGAAAVIRVDGEPRAVLAALDRLDPGHAGPDATMTAVVVTRRSDATATRGMFVEPQAFRQLAYGADRTADGPRWAGLAAPDVAPIGFEADALTLEVGPHQQLGRTEEGIGSARTGTEASIGVTLLQADGERWSSSLGRIPLGPDTTRTLRLAVPCTSGCRLLRFSVTPDGPVSGAVPLATLRAERDGGSQPVALGTSQNWPAVPTTAAGATVQARAGSPGLVLDVASGGGAVSVQYAWAPVVLPVMASAGVRLGTDPTIARPDGSVLPVSPVSETSDAVPRELDGVAVGDLETMLRTGTGDVVPQSSVQVWLSAAAVPRLAEVSAALTDARAPVVEVETVDDALTTQATTASALTSAIASALAVLAMTLAGAGIALTVAGQRAALSRDLAALQLAGLERSRLRSSLLAGYLGPALLAAVLGAAAGGVGAALVIGGLPLVSDPSPAIDLDLGLHPGVLAGSLAASAAVVLLVTVIGVQGVLQRSRTDHVRSLR